LRFAETGVFGLEVAGLAKYVKKELMPLFVHFQLASAALMSINGKGKGKDKGTGKRRKDTDHPDQAKGRLSKQICRLSSIPLALSFLTMKC
jgi:hypothetical protein